MQNVNNFINKNPVHLTTNTILLVVVAIIAFFVLLKVIGGMLKIIALVVVCWFALMSLQSTNIINIPLVKQTYNAIERVIPSKTLWTKASQYLNDAKKAVNDLK